jgi:hypothetical protein
MVDDKYLERIKRQIALKEEKSGSKFVEEVLPWVVLFFFCLFGIIYLHIFVDIGIWKTLVPMGMLVFVVWIIRSLWIKRH